MAVNTYLQDLLLKTSYNGQQLTLLGPFSLKTDGTYSLVTFDNAYFLSNTVVTIATGLVTLNIGQEHVLCLLMMTKHVSELMNVSFSLIIFLSLFCCHFEQLRLTIL